MYMIPMPSHDYCANHITHLQEKLIADSELKAITFVVRCC